MSDGDVYLASASSTENCNTSYPSNREEMEVARMVQPFEENRVYEMKILTKTDKDGFSPAVFRSKLEQKISVSYSVFSLLRFCFVF